MPIKNNILSIKKEISPDIVLVAAAKARSIEEITQAIKAGISIIGENYVHEAEEKFKVLNGKVSFHCIGHLQTNKVKKAVEIFDMIQTVDSIKIAKEIDKRCKKFNKIMPILIEINSGKEKNKSGCTPEGAERLIREISILSNVKIKGLMTIAPFSKDPEKDRPYFKLTKRLFDRIKALNMPNVDMEILSMGMSDSYKIAIQEGSNMVRIGTKIFGFRE